MNTEVSKLLLDFQHCELNISYQNLNINVCYMSYVNYTFKT